MRRSPPAAEPGWTEHRPSRGWRSQLDLRDAWRHRELTWFLALRDVRLRYRQTAFGVAWALIQPLAGVAIFTLVFSRVSGIEHGHVPYFVFAYTAMILWTYTSTSVEGAARSLIEDRSLVERVYFPRILAPAAALLPGLLDLGISLVILAILMAIFAVSVPATALLLPLLLLVALTVSFGVGLWLAALNVQYRDVRYALTFGLQLAFFATPVVYPSSLVRGAWRWVYSANPLVGVIDGTRWAVLDLAPPPAADAISLVAASVILVTGLMYFYATQRRFADVI